MNHSHIPETERLRVEKRLFAYCEQRVPPRVRDRLQLIYRRRGPAITLFERRPYFRDPSRFTESKVARFVYQKESALWRLQCRDRNGRWHPYPAPDGRFEKLLDEVDADPTGIFWG